MDFRRLGPRDGRPVAATAALLLCASALSVLAGQVTARARGADDVEVFIDLGATALVGLGLLVWFTRRSMPGVTWFILATSSVGIVLTFNLVSRDAGGGGQVALLLPVVYAGTFLRAHAASVVAAAAIVADAITVFTLLPTAQALTDHVFMFVAIVTLTWVLVGAGRRQDVLVAELQRVASIDLLTGLATRRVLEEVTRRALTAPVGGFDESPSGGPPGPTARVEERGLALLLIDIDRFKEVNDAHGHPGGDRVLIHIGDLIRGNVRREETVARFGGDELAVLLTGVGQTTAVQLAESLRRSVAEHPVALPIGPVNVTVSIGVAHGQPGTTSLDQLYRAADVALYKAKHGGRNRVVNGTLTAGARAGQGGAVTPGADLHPARRASDGVACDVS